MSKAFPATTEHQKNTTQSGSLPAARCTRFHWVPHIVKSFDPVARTQHDCPARDWIMQREVALFPVVEHKGMSCTGNGLQDTTALVDDPEPAMKNPKAKPSHCAPLRSSFHDRFSAQSITRASYHKMKYRTLDSDATRMPRREERNRAM